MKKKKVKNAILRILTPINVISAIFMACCLDSPSDIPIYIFAANMIYLAIYSCANN